MLDHLHQLQQFAHGSHQVSHLLQSMGHLKSVQAVMPKATDAVHGVSQSLSHGATAMTTHASKTHAVMHTASQGKDIVATTAATPAGASQSQDGAIQLAQSEPHYPVQEASAGGVALVLMPLLLAVGGTALAYWFVKSFLCICKPNEVLVISGRKWRNEDGQEVGYRVLAGGRAIRIPILETIDRLNVNTMPVQVEIRNAYAKGGTPLDIQAIANIKVSSRPNIVGNAIERFLGSKREEIARVARETLEGNLRGVVATLTPEQVNEDRLEFVERISADVSRDLEKLGLEIDTFKIQNVSDEVDYLSSLGRRRIAAILRDAEIAESDAIGEADRIEAECDQESEVAKAQDRIAILEKENELREMRAKLEQTAKSEEEVTEAAARERRAKFEQTLQTVRAELERLRLQADEILPAEARQQAQEINARGNAASFKENAKAEAMANEMMGEVWQNIGSDAPELMVIQQLEMILNEAVKIPSRLHLENISVVDSGDGRSLANLVNLYPDIMAKYLESVNQTLGIDVLGMLNNPEMRTLTPSLVDAEATDSGAARSEVASAAAVAVTEPERPDVAMPDATTLDAQPTDEGESEA